MKKRLQHPSHLQFSLRIPFPSPSLSCRAASVPPTRPQPSRPLRLPCTAARQDAAPPEAERYLLHNRCVASGGAASSRAPSAFPAFAFFASPPLRSLRCSLRIPGRAVGHPEVFQPLETFFPIIGKTAKIFSNHWKTPENFFQSLEKPAQIFQPLEKNFPIIGKIHENFPTIGKKLSNHWKTSPAALLPSSFFLLTFQT